MFSLLTPPARTSGLAAALALPARLAGGAIEAVAGALGGTGGSVGDRQVWSRPGRAHVEVRERDRDGVENLVERVEAVDGVAWCYPDPSCGRIVVDYDEQRCCLEQLLGVIEDAEAGTCLPRGPDQIDRTDHADHSHHTDQEQDDEPLREHPADQRPLTAAAVGLAVSAAGVAAATAGRLAHLRALPTSATAVVAMVDAQPRLRGLLEDRLGPATTDIVLSAANAVVQVLAQGAVSLAVDVAQRSGEVLELAARREVFQAREADLYPAPDTQTRDRDGEEDGRPQSLGSSTRPRAIPPGPVERYAERVAAGGLAAAGVMLIATRSLDRAGQVLLIAAPRAARSSREAFAATLTVGLARHGVVPLSRDAFRRLDRVDTLILDPRVLRSDHRLVLEAEPAVDGWTREEVWSAVQRLLWRGGPLPIPPPRGRRLDRLQLVTAAPGAASDEFDLLEDGEVVGRALVGWELDPLGTALLTAARASALRVVVPEDPNLGPLTEGVDELLPARTRLTDAVRDQQAQGRVVALVSASSLAALRAADVGIGVVRSGSGAVGAVADLVAGPGLDDVRRLLLACGAARRASSAGVTLAAGGAVLGGLLLVAAPPGTPGSRNVLPVHVAALLALGAGTVLAGRVVAAPPAVPAPQVPWHALEPDEVLARLRERGPGDDVRPAERPVETDADAERPGRAGRPWNPFGAVRQLAAQVASELADPLTPVLSTGAAASAILGSGTDALLVGSVMTGNALISGIQRLRADHELRELLLREEVPAVRLDIPAGTPIRDVLDPATATFPARRVRASALRPGDVVQLWAGDVVPADGRLLRVDGLEVDEASLTGESGAVPKQVGATPGADLGEQACMVHEGTAVLAGNGRAVVVAVGEATAAGRAVSLAGQGPPPSGLQVRLQDLTRRVLPVTLLGGGVVSALSMLRGRSAREALGSGVAVTVAAVPEGLPLVTTVAQLAAARRLSHRGVLVRSSRTVEALGRVDTVCFDKTGTLTEGRLRLVRVADLGGEWAPGDERAHELLRAAALASPRGEGPVLHTTDQAVLDAARAHLPVPPDQAWDELGEVPFDSSRGYSAALGRLSRHTELIVKGAPEIILARCTRLAAASGGDGGALGPPERERARRVVERLARDGLRVLAVAYRHLDEPRRQADAEADLPDAVADLTLLGFVALADTPRPEAADAVQRLRDAGVSVVMITGDHPVTARAVAAQVGFASATVLTGRDLEGLDEDARVRAVTAAQVFARVSPEQKVRIVEALHLAGRVVAMTGDGTNDAAAIRLADVGIGMGIAGSTAARRAGDLVLTRPDLRLVLDALGEGRAMWRRARQAVAILVGGNLGEVAFTVLGTVLAGRAPLGTRQFLLVNLLTDLFPAMAVAVAPDGEPVAGPPPVEDRSALLRGITLRGIVTASAATVAWVVGRMTGTPRRASTMGLAALVGAQLGQTLVVAYRDPGVVVTALGSAAALAAVVSIPGVSHVFGCTPLDPAAWAVVVACAAVATGAAVVAPRLVRFLAPSVGSSVGPSVSYLRTHLRTHLPTWAGTNREPDGDGHGAEREPETLLASAR